MDQYVVFIVFKLFCIDFGGSGGIEGGCWGHLGAALRASGAVLKMLEAAWGCSYIDKTNFSDFEPILEGPLGIKIRGKSVPGKKNNCKSFRPGFPTHFLMILKSKIRSPREAFMSSVSSL